MPKRIKIFVGAITALLLAGSIYLVFIKNGHGKFLGKTNTESVVKAIDFNKAYQECLAQPSFKQIGICLQTLASQVGAGYRLSDLEISVKNFSDPHQLNWCHEFMHYVGWATYEQKKSLPGAFAVASGLCDNGMYHGIMEEYIKDLNVGFDTEKFANDIIPHACDSIAEDKSLPRATVGPCYHGLGHAFMFVTDNNVSQSLELCDHIGQAGPQGCYTGVFMEDLQAKQVGSALGEDNKISFDSQDPNSPCDKLPTKYQSECYIYKGVSKVNGQQPDYAAGFQACSNITNEYKDQCFFGIGADIPAPQFTSKQAAAKCDAALAVSPDAYKQCIVGAMSFVAELNLGNFQSAVDFCSVIDSGYKNNCYQAAGTYFKGWSNASSTIEQKCALFSDANAKNLCLQAAQ